MGVDAVGAFALLTSNIIVNIDDIFLPLNRRKVLQQGSRLGTAQYCETALSPEY